MLSLVERLVESWLDKQTERRYQNAFVQLLVSEGWSVLHTTRHSPIEFGKDIIARNPGGELFCFQLKGNPGTRVTKSEAQKLLAQVDELIILPAPEHFLKFANERHVAVFVTNGEVDEEAALLFEQASKKTASMICPASSLVIWRRGDLLSLFLKHAKDVWPTSFEGTRLMLEIFSGDGREIPSSFDLSTVFSSCVPYNEDVSAPGRDAALSSLLLLSEILKSRWYATEDHIVFTWSQ